MKRKRLGEILRDEGLISEEQLQAALERQKTEKGLRIGEVLVAMGAVTAEDVAQAIWQQRQIPYVDLDNYALDPKVIELVPERIARAYLALPIFKIGNALTVAMADPFNLIAVDDLRSRTGCEIETVISTEDKIEKCLDHYYRMDESITQLIAGVAEEEGEKTASKDPAVAAEIGEAPVIKLANLIIQQAVRDGASDIHIEPGEHDVKVRYRIDGMLHEINKIPKTIQEAITSRFKVWAEVDVTEKRTAQDGRFFAGSDGKRVEVRLSTFPTIYGENLVMRILDPTATILELKSLGLPPAIFDSYIKLVKATQGMVLVTGPTGSGKTTTLYATLDTVRDPALNIITIEDPVEYRLEGIRQTQVNPQGGVTFAAGLRAIVRQDPDVIMVGEIRDLETAQMAVRASLTGHVVFSTLHTNDAPGSITRLLDIGVEPFLISSGVTGVLAQRLARTVCRSCKEPYVPSEEDLEQFGIAERAKGRTFFRGRGCQGCRFSGYRGRVGIYELLLVTDAIRDLINQRSSDTDIRKAALKTGDLRTLYRDGLEKAVKGVTTLEEISRIVHLKGE
ncbi:MAG: ATPase, T2SS/T4P/T4SS family [Deltaproteobacteria bacterium]|jgi:type IV pilus assembly protein PilB|nr:ATPase, T2SS/T4P/T4SS family [Deltaproteobacteria bacterium]